MLSLELYILTIVISVVAFVYSQLLVDQGMILFKWKELLFNRLYKKHNWLFKIIVDCVYCVSGQWALWIYLYLSIIGTEKLSIEYDIFQHVVFVSFTIFNVLIIKKAGLYGSE